MGDLSQRNTVRTYILYCYLYTTIRYNLILERFQDINGISSRKWKEDIQYKEQYRIRYEDKQRPT